MLYFFVIAIVLFLAHLFSVITVKFVFDGELKIEIHFVFLSLHLRKKTKGKRVSLSFAALLRALTAILEKSTVRIKRLTVPVNSSPTLPDIKYLGINISYPALYAYLITNSRKLIISENAVTKETTENFKFFVNISLQILAINLISPILSLAFTKKNGKRRRAWKVR